MATRTGRPTWNVQEEEKKDASEETRHRHNISRGLQDDIDNHVDTALSISALSSEWQEMRQDIKSTQRVVQDLQQRVCDLQHECKNLAASRPDATSLLAIWNRFFHARVGEQGILLASQMRLAYGLLCVVDKLLLALDLHTFLSPTAGMLPLWAERQTFLQQTSTPKHSILEWYPESDAFLWAIHWMGLYCAVMLLAGIYPRVHAIGVLISQVAVQHHNHLLFDGEDVMFRVWLVHMMCMPIHRLTLSGLWKNMWRTKEEKQKQQQLVREETWPIWPFRLLQIQICCVYMGAGLIKWTGHQWSSGTALFYMVHNDDFYGKWLNPDIFFNYMFSIKFFTWSALTVETSAPFLVWPTATRKYALFAIIMLHLGMELSLNMHCFEWLTIWAWCSFFVEEPVVT